MSLMVKEILHSYAAAKIFVAAVFTVWNITDFCSVFQVENEKNEKWWSFSDSFHKFSSIF